MPFMQTATPLADTGQTIPQPPQLSGSTAVLTHPPPQQEIPWGQSQALQLPSKQELPSGQTLPQLPQLLGSFCRLVHCPLFAQRIWLGAQTVWQNPFWQVWP